MTKKIIEYHGCTTEYVVCGSGQPTIVFEAGLGANLKTWDTIMNDLKGVSRTFAYNRAGYGKSRSKNKDRCGSVIAEELHTLLQELSYKPPYLLVGHSLGGAYMEIFAQKYPHEVFSLILIDPMAVEMDELCEDGGLTEWQPSTFRKIIIAIFLSRGAKQELKKREITLTQTKQTADCSNQFPVVVISAGKSMWSAQLQTTWLKSHELLAKRYANCSHIIAPDSGHDIQKDEPDIVTNTILAALKGETNKNQ